MEDNKKNTTEKNSTTESLADKVKVLSPGTLVAKRFFRSKLSITGIVILIFLFAFSFFGPLISPWGEAEQDTSLKDQYAETFVLDKFIDANGEEVEYYKVTYTRIDINALAKPSLKHWLGTDNSGYDVLTRLMYGGRISLTLGFVVVILETIFGVILGGLAGYLGKWVDNLIMRIVDILNCIPSLPLMLIISSILEANKVDPVLRIYYMMIFLTLVGWSGIARLVRGQILFLREQEFIVAADAMGLSTSRKIFKHLIPNVLPQLIVTMTLGLGSVILTEATLGYLGLGVALPRASWGNMINLASNMTYLKYYPNLWIAPGICIVLAVLAFNFAGDGLRDAFDPRSKR